MDEKVTVNNRADKIYVWDTVSDRYNSDQFQPFFFLSSHFSPNTYQTRDLRLILKRL